MTVESPCVGVCRLAETAAVCVGCHRTLSEIAAWIRLDEMEKLRVLTAIKKRQEARAATTTGAQTR
jgi:uncharacterized protein